MKDSKLYLSPSIAGGGLGLFTSKAVKVGEVLFEEEPLMTVNEEYNP